LQIGIQYSKIARKYDQIRFGDELGRKKSLGDAIIIRRLMFPLSNGLVLDLGCGTCRISKVIREVSEESMLVGLDISREMLSVCSEKNVADLLILGDSEKLPFREGSFDVVVSYRLLSLPVDWERIVSEVSRVLKVGGYFLAEIGNSMSIGGISNGIKKVLGRETNYRTFHIWKFLKVCEEQSLFPVKIVGMHHIHWRLVPRKFLDLWLETELRLGNTLVKFLASRLHVLLMKEVS